MTAQYKVWYKDSIVLTKDDMERIRAFVLYAMFCRSLSFCSTTSRNLEGERFLTGCTTERLILGIDARSMFGRFGNARRERLMDWALGVRPFFQMPEIEQTMLRQDMIRLRDMATGGGYAHLLGLDPRVAS
jgi:hypothetical protein